MRLTTVVLFILFLVGGRLARSQALSDMDLAALVEATYANCQGAAFSTQQRIVRNLWDRVFMSPMEVGSATANALESATTRSWSPISKLCKGLTFKDANSTGLASLGVTLRPPSKGSTRAPLAYWKGPVAETWTSRGIFTIVGASVDQLDGLRKGSKFSYTGRILGLSASGPVSDPGHLSVTVWLDSLELPKQMLSCPDGHEYPVTSNFAFCPKDGKPVKAR